MRKIRRPDGFSLTAVGVFVLLIAAFMAIPIFTLVKASFSMPQTGSFTLSNYAEVFTKKLYQMSFVNSVGLSLQSSLYGMAIALVCSYALTRFASEKTRNNLLVVVNMTSNFAGMPLAFALTLMLGNTGMFIILLNQMGINITDAFDLYSVQGLVLAYTYFQVPLGIMLLYPIYQAIRADWKEAAAILGATKRQFWLKIGIPTLLPSVFSTFTLLFANAMGAYATAYSLVSSSYNLVPIRIGALMSGDIRTRPELGSALAVILALVLIVMMLLSDWASRIAAKGGIKG